MCACERALLSNVSLYFLFPNVAVVVRYGAAHNRPVMRGRWAGEAQSAERRSPAACQATEELRAGCSRRRGDSKQRRMNTNDHEGQGREVERGLGEGAGEVAKWPVVVNMAALGRVNIVLWVYV